jgi:oligopeptide/dipeptide ABC transporter ATP-binding protein
MYLGHIVEEGTVEDIFDRPMHPYTMGHQVDLDTRNQARQKLYMIKGTVPR